MDAAFSFASSCRDESVCLIAGVVTWLVVTWQPVLLCEGACRLRGCPSNGRVSEFESDRLLSYQLWSMRSGLRGCFVVGLLVVSVASWSFMRRASMMRGFRLEW
jgi:hypothetical protein